jgi:hypothetical protein
MGRYRRAWSVSPATLYCTQLGPSRALHPLGELQSLTAAQACDARLLNFLALDTGLLALDTVTVIQARTQC